MARRNGRSYVVKGEAPKRYWEPSQGDVVYIEGTRTKLGKPYQDPDTGKAMFPLRPGVRGTTDMSAGNIRAIARVEAATANPRQRKTQDVWVVQGNYGYGHGWEDVTAEETYKEARQRVKEYRENEPGVPFRVKLTRERIETATDNPKRTFKVMTSFGGHLVGKFSSEAAARKKAASSRRKPVDVWSTTGGAMGQGKVIAHYGAEKNPTGLTDASRFRDIVERWKVRGEQAARSGKYEYVDAAWRKLKPKTVNDVFFASRSAFFKGFMAVREGKNPAPAGVEAIPTKWTKATISTRGKQIQIRTGGR